MTNTIRAFVAIPLPQNVLDWLSRHQRRLDRTVPGRSVRWTRSEGLHITLKFLGDTPTEKLPDIRQALAAVARHASAPNLSVGGLGGFPNLYRPRVIWVGVEELSGRLTALQSAVEEALGSLGYSPERRGFSPHLTLGRVRRGSSRGDAARVGDVVKDAKLDTIAGISASHFSLIRSILKSSGAEYITLEEFPLGS